MQNFGDYFFFYYRDKNIRLDSIMSAPNLNHERKLVLSSLESSEKTIERNTSDLFNFNITIYLVFTTHREN